MTVWPPKYDCKLQRCYCRKKTIYVHQINNDQHVQKVVPANVILYTVYTVYTMTSSQKRSQLVNNLRLHTVHSIHNDPPPTCTCRKWSQYLLPKGEVLFTMLNVHSNLCRRWFGLWQATWRITYCSVHNIECTQWSVQEVVRIVASNLTDCSDPLGKAYNASFCSPAANASNPQVTPVVSDKLTSTWDFPGIQTLKLFGWKNWLSQASFKEVIDGMVICRPCCLVLFMSSSSYEFQCLFK